MYTIVYILYNIYIYYLYAILFHNYEQFTGGAPFDNFARRLHREVGWDHPERLWTGPNLEDGGKNPGKTWEKHGKTWENHGKIIGKPWENGNTVVKTWKNRGKTMGKWENHWKKRGKTMENDGKGVKPPKQNNWRLWYNLLGFWNEGTVDFCKMHFLRKPQNKQDNRRMWPRCHPSHDFCSSPGGE